MDRERNRAMENDGFERKGGGLTVANRKNTTAHERKRGSAFDGGGSEKGRSLGFGLLVSRERERLGNSSFNQGLKIDRMDTYGCKSIFSIFFTLSDRKFYNPPGRFDLHSQF